MTKAKSSDIVKLRVNLFADFDPLYLDAFSIEEDFGFEDICIHGCSNSVQIRVKGKLINMSAPDFANFLNNQTSNKGGNIRLVSCETGKGENSFAQQLSEILSVTVKAPDDDIYYAPDEGTVFVGASYANIGKWRTFKNGVEVFETYRLVFRNAYFYG